MKRGPKVLGRGSLYPEAVADAKATFFAQLASAIAHCPNLRRPPNVNFVIRDCDGDGEIERELVAERPTSGGPK